MSDQHGKGSILLKLAVVVFIVLLIIVITTPGKIWSSEEKATKICRDNMLSLYEAHSYYFKIKSTHAPDMTNLILTIQNDSSLLKRELIVKHTVRLREGIESFQNSPIVSNLYKIASNIKNTEDDFVANERFFKSQDQEVLDKRIFTRSQELKMKLSTFRSGVEFENFRNTVTELDSLWQVRRDLADFSLQNASRWASILSAAIVKNLPNIDYTNLQQTWEPLSTEITDFLNTVNSIEKLKSATTVADRVADFQGKISNAFSEISSARSANGMTDAEAKASDLAAIYQGFLGDFIITQYFAQYKLTDTDSLLLALSDNNFVTPVDKLPYVVSFGDSMDLRVEDPSLLKQIKEKTDAQVDLASQLAFLDHFSEYDKTLDSLNTFYLEVKANYRRNLDVTIKTKELDELIPRLRDVSAFAAYKSLKQFADVVPSSDSYSEIKDLISEGIISSGSFIQIYQDNFFGNLDTLHQELLMHLDDFENIVSGIRQNTYSFAWAKDKLNSEISQIKNTPASEVMKPLEQIKEGLEEAFIYASEGDERTVYGIFTTHIQNHGKVYGRAATKSWEKED